MNGTWDNTCSPQANGEIVTIVKDGKQQNFLKCSCKSKKEEKHEGS